MTGPTAKQNERASGKMIRVYDASDLEQWLEQSVLQQQAWLSEQNGLIQRMKALSLLTRLVEAMGWSLRGEAVRRNATLLFEEPVKAYEPKVREWLSCRSQKSRW